MKTIYSFLIIITFMAQPLLSNKTYTVPQNNRIKYNLNYDLRFNKADAINSQTIAFNDASWKLVSLPQTYNDVDFFDTCITESGHYGWAGKTCYRKPFKLDATLVGRRVIVELEGVRQAGEFYINGTSVGRHEDDVSPCGIDKRYCS